MDGLKVFAKNKKDMDVCIAISTRFSHDIDMSFSLDKCVVSHTVMGKIVRPPFIHDIPQLSGGDSYK